MSFTWPSHSSHTVLSSTASSAQYSSAPGNVDVSGSASLSSLPGTPPK